MMEQKKIKCLYYIKDNRTDKIIYIGQTKDFKQREYDHFAHKKTPIDSYMFNEGRENFLIFPFVDIDATNFTDDDLRKKEDELILFYDTINNGFNKRRSGNIEKDDIKKYYREREKTKQRKEYKRKYQNSEKRKEYLKKYRSTEEYKERQREASHRYRARKKQEKYSNSDSL